MYILCVHTLLKVVGYYDLSVLSMSVMGFQEKKFGWGWVGGWGELYPRFLLLGFLLCKIPYPMHAHSETSWLVRVKPDQCSRVFID